MSEDSVKQYTKAAIKELRKVGKTEITGIVQDVFLVAQGIDNEAKKRSWVLKDQDFSLYAISRLRDGMLYPMGKYLVSRDFAAEAW